MQLSAILLLLLAFIVGRATFIENDYGTQSAKALIYNSHWFEALLAFIMINLIGSIIKYKMYRKERLAMFVFHIAFIIMILGAGITRFISYEGTMHIRENSSSDHLISRASYLTFKASKDGMQVSNEKKVILASLGHKKFNESLKFNNDRISFKYVDFIQAATEEIIEDPNGDMIISMMISAGMGRNVINLHDGEKIAYGNLVFALNDPQSEADVHISGNASNLQVSSKIPYSKMSMIDQKEIAVNPDTTDVFSRQTLYNFSGVQIVIQNIVEHGATRLVSSTDAKNSNLKDAIVIDVSVNDKSDRITIFGRPNSIGEPMSINLEGYTVECSYGAKIIDLPFSLVLKDFQLQKYPGSNTPSSYASEVIVSDPSKNVNMPYRIYMNHILNYRGYRFFQSSYDQDEKGTILSVNHDGVGTLITYISYILLALGLILTLFNRHSRIRFVLRESSKIRSKRKAALTIIALFIIGISSVNAQGNYKEIPVEHARKFSKIIVLDHAGRVEPVNTLSSEILRKLYRKTSYNGLNPDQVFLDMMVSPEYWQNQRIIKVSNKALQAQLGMEGKYIAFSEIVDFNSSEGYKIQNLVTEANQKEPRLRSKFDKEVLHVDERVNICYYVFIGSFFNAFPLENDPDNRWVSPDEFKEEFKDLESSKQYTLLKEYFDAVSMAKTSGNWTDADKKLQALADYQKSVGKDVVISDKKRDIEILYNDVNIFVQLERYYSLIGLVLLILSFMNILLPKWNLKWPFRIFAWILGILFIAHTAGLAVRWYISGHAPWSNAYESMVFIAWTTILAGIIFVRKSQITLTATALMATLILSVAHMNWLDPEITNLVPVLKSYWLVIHVATITSSYGFLGLGAIVASFTLILMILKTRKNANNINMAISEFTYVIEATLQIGLVLLTIGTFLGGVWANESWGRYWGWDPKETWSLVTLLVYAFVLHMRFIPALKGVFTFNFMALISYGSVLMTYFGVNYYLAGMHSYAKGEAAALPTFAYYTIAAIIVLSLAAYFRNKRLPIDKS